MFERTAYEPKQLAFGSFFALLDERLDDRLGVLTGHLSQHHVTRMALDQGAM